MSERHEERPAGGALARFAGQLDSAALADVRGWRNDPELGALYTGLDGHGSLKPFLDGFAEALIARHLRARGCALQFEVPTPGGRACDFEVRRDDAVFYLHVKRLDTDRPARRRLTISSRLRYLERIRRPYLVSVRWHEGTNDRKMERLVASASDFIRHARVGDELVVHDEDGSEIGGVLIVGPWEGSHVSLAIGLPSGFIDEARRMRRLVRRAHRQFMPRAANVILICSSHSEEYEDFESALIGSHVERWDAFPPTGRRIAHGRAADGIWHQDKYQDSRAAGWFQFDPARGDIAVRLLFRRRPSLEPAMSDFLREVFETGERERASVHR
ncbi:MAG: hypothetical protein HKO59_13195 [Phycisphaerales bacterium]|nr:hypothetical protein [Phycisphaerae bacterium]NNF44258.1 hypothetical protein [Phycisphaerales bacterium]NNM26918.1 hypothetical protein [Phycisphaerales bacterium]